MTRILVVEDDQSIAFGLRVDLESEGYAVAVEHDGLRGLERARSEPFDLILLDVMLPGRDGFDICRDLRRAGSTVPVILLTAKTQEAEIVMGLELGADDYVTKPFSPRELVLRIKRLLRAAPAGETLARFQWKDLTLDTERHEVTIKGKAVDLTATEFKLLTVLAQRRGRVQSREQLLQDVWEYDSLIDTRTVDVHMRRLREKLGPAAKYLDTVRGVGYRFVSE